MTHVDNLYPILFLIDFGLAQLFHDPATYLHVPFTMNNSIVGTPQFISINGQQGYAQSRCDDLESLTYMIIYMTLGDLPWTGNNMKAVL
jgi:serine/threonine protein kinase